MIAFLGLVSNTRSKEMSSPQYRPLALALSRRTVASDDYNFSTTSSYTYLSSLDMRIRIETRSSNFRLTKILGTSIFTAVCFMLAVVAFDTKTEEDTNFWFFVVFLVLAAAGSMYVLTEVAELYEERNGQRQDVDLEPGLEEQVEGYYTRTVGGETDEAELALASDMPSGGRTERAQEEDGLAVASDIGVEGRDSGEQGEDELALAFNVGHGERDSDHDSGYYTASDDNGSDSGYGTDPDPDPEFAGANTLTGLDEAEEQSDAQEDELPCIYCEEAEASGIGYFCRYCRNAEEEYPDEEMVEMDITEFT